MSMTAPDTLTLDGPTPPEHWFARLGRFSAHRRKPVMLLWLAIGLGAAPLAISVNGALSGAGWEAQGSIAQRVRDELRTDFPQVGAEAAIVVIHQGTPISTDPTAVKAIMHGLTGADGVEAVADPLALPADAGLISADGLTALIPVELVADDAQLPESAGLVIDKVASLTLPTGARAEVTGEWPVWSDFNTSNEEALHKAELLSGLPTLILLFIAFGSAIAAGLPLLLAVSGIGVGFAGLHLATSVTPMSVWSMNFSMMIGLAVGIDYALFIVSRYREEREDGKDASEAMASTLDSAGKAVFLSALTVVLSLAAVFLVPVMVFRSMALGMILSVIAVAIASLTLLPAVLVALGNRVLVARPEDDPDRAAEGRWARWTALVMKRPGISLATGLAVLLLLAAPALGMRLGMPGARVVDEGRSSRDGYEMVVSAFGPGAAAPLFVTVDAEQAAQVVATAQADSGVVDARIVAEPSATTGRTVVRVTPSTAVDDAATSDLIGRLRSSIADTSPTASVGGPAAQNYDLTDVLTGKAPLAIAVITIVAFMLLLIVFRSLALAISSILLNFVSVGAAFGFATLVFQHGWGAGLIGIDPQGFVNAWAPLFFFALLFGLSMDYQLFLLAAIRERYEVTGDTQLAIRDCIARTGRPITNAALIMIVVFIAFGVTGPIPPTELGITLALAVLLDATVVRMMLVPSLMTLLGERNWWIPGWLDKRLPHVHFSH